VPKGFFDDADKNSKARGEKAGAYTRPLFSST